MAERFNKNRISEIQDRSVFVDANVLIYLNWSAPGSEQNEIQYSTVYQELITQKNKLFVDFLVISEVVNRILRIEHQRKIPEQNFKQFRDSENGQSALSDIYKVIENSILEDFNIIGKSFSENDIKGFLCVDNLDFMDKGILKICQENNFVLLTNDKDYKNSDIDILTCNKNILN
jgi:predicted nucleic acid-binding protein